MCIIDIIIISSTITITITIFIIIINTVTIMLAISSDRGEEARSPRGGDGPILRKENVSLIIGDVCRRHLFCRTGSGESGNGETESPYE